MEWVLPEKLAVTQPFKKYPNIHYKSPPLIPILSQMNPPDIFILFLYGANNLSSAYEPVTTFKIQFNVILPSTVRSS
jgi:hypothetical protein